LDQAFWYTLLAPGWCRDNVAKDASDFVISNGGTAAAAKLAGIAASADAYAAVLLNTPGAVDPIPFTDVQLRYMYSTPSSTDFYEAFVRDLRDYEVNNHKLWGLLAEACSDERDITAHIEKRVKSMTPQQRLSLPGNDLLNDNMRYSQSTIGSLV